MWKTLQTFSTIIYSYSLLAVCSTHGSCVVVLPYYWHNIAVDVFEMKTVFLQQIIIKVHFLCDQTYFFRFMFGHFNLIHYFWERKFVPLRAMMLTALRRSHLKECRLVEGKHKKSVIGAWFSGILKLRTLHGQLRNLATVMPMGM